MSLCVNPTCPRPDHPENQSNRFCQSCGSNLVLQERYRVLRLLSDKTGFGKIYEACEGDTPKILKVLKEELNSSDKAVELFQQEAEVLGELNHPGIPKVDGYFQYQSRNGQPLHCTVMEKIEGWNLDEWVRQRGNQPISQAQAIAWLKQLAEILQLVHSKQYLHRDIKPSNIMIAPSGQLVLIDFGTAREMTVTYLAKRGAGHPITSIESRGYSAPEQINGQAVPQSDFFSLGRTFVFLLTARQPLEMYDSYSDALNWQRFAAEVSPLLLNVIDWLMARDVRERPASAREILQRLREVEAQLDGTLIPAGGSGGTETGTQTLPVASSEQNQFPLAVAAAVLLAFLAYLGDKLKNTASPPATSRPNKFPLVVFILVILPLLGLAALTLAGPQVACLLGLSSENCAIAFKRPPRPGQPPQRKGKVDFFPYQEGRDSKGRTAEFSVAVLSVEYKWSFGSYYQIQYNDKVITVDDLRANLEQEGIQKIMENPSEIISIGTASCEGERSVEERRALERAKQIQLLAKKLFSKVGSVKGYRLLNLGQFVRDDCQAGGDLTSYQRSIIIVGVRKKSEGVLLDEALRSRLENRPFADFTLDDYSLGSAEKFRTIPSQL
ncbi:serine/threonine protein kinase [Kamptonema formosum]|uniref:serine/threonine protein kinase n=1 Tax=Kamptonema formosum TaxID=331992 RepID=UPI00034D1E13|nr:serine/threonine-protein kinase [Oscillatoria sp. PCC 10802]